MAGLVQSQLQTPSSTGSQPNGVAPNIAPSNGSPPNGAPNNPGAIVNPILQKIVAGIRAQIPPQLITPYLQVLTAGKKVMFSPQTSQYMIQQLKNPNSLIANVSSGIAMLMAVLYRESKRQMSIPAGLLASIELMAEALDVAEKVDGINITPAIASACAHATAIAVLLKFGIGPAAIQGAIHNGQQKMRQHGGNPSSATSVAPTSVAPTSVAPTSVAPQGVS